MRFIENMPWIGAPFNRDAMNKLAVKIGFEGVPTLAIMNMDETVAEKKGRGDIALRLA